MRRQAPGFLSACMSAALSTPDVSSAARDGSPHNQSLDIREYRVGFRQQAMSREEAQSSMFKMLQEAWEKNNGFDDDEWGETQSPPFILKRATDKKVTFGGGARRSPAL